MSEFAGKAEFEGAECIRETPKAILVKIDENEIWFPKWAIDDDSEVWKEGQSGKLVIAERVAEEKGLI